MARLLLQCNQDHNNKSAWSLRSFVEKFVFKSKRRKWRRVIYALVGALMTFLVVVIFLANFYVEPALRKRLETLIVEGSDSLYIYTLGDLDVNFFGGNVGVRELKIKVDSNRYNQLQRTGELPSLVMQLNINRAHIKGVGVFSLLFGKKIIINEISSEDADIKLNRFLKKRDTAETRKEKLPLWKAIRPRIKDVLVNRIRLNGIKLLYKNEEGDEAKLQFDRCDALFENIRIDSAAANDTSRLSYVENVSFRLNDLKFRTPDSTYKLKAEWITYSSAKRLLAIDSFKLQPTIKNNERIDTLRKTWYTVTFDKMSFEGLRLDRYLWLNRAEADSVVFQNLTLGTYQDKKGLRSYESKIGKYPHQLLLNADAIIDIKKIVTRNMQIVVTERHAETREVGTINLNDVNLTVENIVNDSTLFKQRPITTANATGKLIGSPIQASFRFYLDSAEGHFDVKGRIGPVAAAQINPLSTRLANIEVPTVQIGSIDFFVRGEDFEATSDVKMQYNNLSLIFRRRDDETGISKTRNFLTKIINRYAINPSNPTGGRAVQASNIRVARLTTQSFFGIIWKAVFEGMQRIMLKSGQIG